MVLGWRRAFCTSIPRDRDSTTNHTCSTTKQHKNTTTNTTSSSEHQQSNPTTPKLSSKLSFFSNPSTPRLQAVSSPRLRCRTTPSTPPPPVQQVPPPESPKLNCKTGAKNSPRFFQLSSISNPSSPRSPSTFSLLKSTLRFSKTRCGICLHSIKSGQGTAIFTAECSHCFHFPCVAGHVKKQGTLTCPVCNSTWTEMPLLSIHNVVTTTTGTTRHKVEVKEKKMEFPSSPKTPPPPSQSWNKHPLGNNGRSALKVYDDDEPLMSPTCGARFNPIPESDENDEDNENILEEFEFQGFHPSTTTHVEARILPDAAVVSACRSSQTCVVVLKIRAPPAPGKNARRAPIDLVTVLDVSGKMTNDKLQIMRRAMRLVVSSLSANDRLSIVAFSSTSKRLLPLRRMTTAGRRSARRIVDAVVALDGTASASANDAIKKAAKVLEDRRERNPVASIILFSDAVDDRSTNPQRRQSSVVYTTRFTHLEVPVLSVGLNNHGSAYAQDPPTHDDALAKCVKGLLSVVVQDLRIHLGLISGSSQSEISGVYSYTGRPMGLGSGLVRLGEFFAEEERELLVELKVPSSSSSSMSSVGNGAHHVLSVRCSYKDPSTQELIQGKEQALMVPRPLAVRSSGMERLRCLFVATRAVAESRRLVERNDLGGAHHMLSSARAIVLQTSSGSADEFVRGLEAELSELQCRRQNQLKQQIRRRPNVNVERRNTSNLDEKSTEPVTPTSAWRAAERLAKVAIMRKSMNRVSDLHGFENARF